MLQSSWTVMAGGQSSRAMKEFLGIKMVFGRFEILLKQQQNLALSTLPYTPFQQKIGTDQEQKWMH